jgi:hypothetical protein
MKLPSCTHPHLFPRKCNDNRSLFNDQAERKEKTMSKG